MTSPGDHPRIPRGTRRRAIVFGDRIAPYHPIGAVEVVFHSIFGSGFDLRFAATSGELARLETEDVLVVGYADMWETLLADEAAHGLVRHVERGGGLLILHNGVSWARHPLVFPLIGAAFSEHPSATILRYEKSKDHLIAAGLAGFEIREEPYRYTFTPGFAADVFLHYTHEGTSWPAGWAKIHGAGRVAVLQPGHDVSAFEHPAYAAWVRRSALWCARCLSSESGGT